MMDPILPARKRAYLATSLAFCSESSPGSDAIWVLVAILIENGILKTNTQSVVSRTCAHIYALLLRSARTVRTSKPTHLTSIIKQLGIPESFNFPATLSHYRLAQHFGNPQ